MTNIKIMVGDVIERLRDLPDKSVHCCVTSPPYWGLRDYGTASWEGGDPDCDHEETRGGTGAASSKQVTSGGTQGYQFKDVCGKCGAVRVDKQLGLEPTIGEFIEKLTDVFEEVRRVLRDDGTLWLNMGDAYNGSGKGAWDKTDVQKEVYVQKAGTPATKVEGLKPKDLIGQPWRLAFALQAAGWYLRSEIIWQKQNPMPESVTDRPTKSHEQIFLLTKRPRYFYDADAVKERATTTGDDRAKRTDKTQTAGRGGDESRKRTGQPTGSHRNLRDVWKIAAQPFPDAHFATFPQELPRKCILAGTSEKGCCPECGVPWTRIVEKTRTHESGSGKSGNAPKGKHGADLQGGGETGDIRNGPCVESKTIGWQPGCECLDVGHAQAISDGKTSAAPCVVLDPFGGAGTTALVAAKMGRSAILTELNREYANMAADRIRRECGLLATVEVDEMAPKTTSAIV